MYKLIIILLLTIFLFGCGSNLVGLDEIKKHEHEIWTTLGYEIVTSHPYTTTHGAYVFYVVKKQCKESNEILYCGILNYNDEYKQVILKEFKVFKEEKKEDKK